MGAVAGLMGEVAVLMGEVAVVEERAGQQCHSELPRIGRAGYLHKEGIANGGLAAQLGLQGSVVQISVGPFAGCTHPLCQGVQMSRLLIGSHPMI